MTQHSKLKELAEKATQGPWTSYRNGYAIVVADTEPHAAKTTQNICLVHDHKNNDPQADKTASFIAAANPTTILSLLSEIESLKEQVRILKDCAYWYAVYADEIVLEHAGGKEKSKKQIAKEALTQIEALEKR